MQQMRLQDRVAIVTGGGSGIGTAYTRRFVAEGAKVMIADIGEEQGRNAARELAGDGDVEFVRTDIADPASAQAAVDATVERFGHVDILVNNAAIYGDYNGGDNSLEYLKQVFDVNLHGQWVMAKAVAPLPGAASAGAASSTWRRSPRTCTSSARRPTPTTSSSAATRTCSRSGECSGSPATWRASSASSTSPSTASRPGS